MSEWLDVMLSEVARKRDEELAALEESQRRTEPNTTSEKAKTDKR